MVNKDKKGGHGQEVVREYTRRRPRKQRDLLDLDTWLLSNSGSGGGNGVYNACGAGGRRCADSVYGTYDYHVYAIPPSLHPPSE
jgi:hypothetical protein